MSLFSGDPLHMKMQENFADMGVKPQSPGLVVQAQNIDLNSQPQAPGVDSMQNAAEGLMSMFASPLSQDRSLGKEHETAPKADMQGQELLNDIVDKPDDIKTGQFDKGASQKANQNELRGQQVENAIQQRMGQLEQKQQGAQPEQNTKMNNPGADSSLTARIKNLPLNTAIETGAVALAGVVAGPQVGAALAIGFGLKEGAGLLGVAPWQQPSQYKTSFDSSDGKRSHKKNAPAPETGPSKQELQRLRELSKGSAGVAPSKPSQGQNMKLDDKNLLSDRASIAGMSLTDSQMTGMKLDEGDPVLMRLQEMKQEVSDYKGDLKHYVDHGVVLTKDSLHDAVEMNEIDLDKQISEGPDSGPMIVHHNINMKGPGLN